MPKWKITEVNRIARRIAEIPYVIIFLWTSRCIFNTLNVYGRAVFYPSF